MSQKSAKKLRSERPFVDIETIKRIEVRPDEILAIRLPDTATQQMTQMFNQFVKTKFPDLRFIAYTGELKFKALKQTPVLPDKQAIR